MTAIVDRRSAVTLLSLFLASLFCGGLAAAAQEVRMTGMAGEGMSDATLGQGVAIVVVWASWSPRSRDIVERVRPLAGRWGPRARVLTVDFEEARPAIEAFLAGRSLGVPTYLDADGAFCKKYAIATLPGLLVIKDGKTVYHGRLPDDPDRLLADLLR
ncbi:MAG TPA: hypothetical protein VKY89_20225 [Thermoanaerobaculia bacterium]|nr:hypothetical protein [Thermoanaerobaculia bacterium]